MGNIKPTERIKVQSSIKKDKKFWYLENTHYICGDNSVINYKKAIC